MAEYEQTEQAFYFHPPGKSPRRTQRPAKAKCTLRFVPSASGGDPGIDAYAQPLVKIRMADYGPALIRFLPITLLIRITFSSRTAIAKSVRFSL